MRYPRKVDENQPEIVEALRGMGCSVQSLAAVGDGCPDLLVGFRGVNVVLEVKNLDGKGLKLTPKEKVWHDEWRGQKAVVQSVQLACSIVLAADRYR